MYGPDWASEKSIDWCDFSFGPLILDDEVAKSRVLTGSALSRAIDNNEFPLLSALDTLDYAATRSANGTVANFGSFESFREFLAGKHVLGLFRHDALLGYMALSPADATVNQLVDDNIGDFSTVFLDSMMVDPKYHKSTAATNLHAYTLSHLLKNASVVKEAMGLDQGKPLLLALWVHPKNMPALCFYRNWGYETICNQEFFPFGEGSGPRLPLFKIIEGVDLETDILQRRRDKVRRELLEILKDKEGYAATMLQKALGDGLEGLACEEAVTRIMDRPGLKDFIVDLLKNPE